MALSDTTEIHQFTCLSDNFGVLLHDNDSGTTIAFDVPDAGLYEQALEKKGWKLSHILITHHHWDHVQGLVELKQKTGASVIGSSRCRHHIAQIQHVVKDGEHILCGPYEVKALATPGHTLDQISWYVPAVNMAHTGDTLFSLGCGRVFEGDMQMMWSSLDKLLRELPDETSIYCGHEYTEANARFALTIEPGNAELQRRAQEVSRLRSAGEPTLPTTMAQEKATNPFLRAAEATVAEALGMDGKSAAEIFAEIRTRKDNA